MKITEQDLREQYEKLETEELIELYTKTELSDLASSILTQILGERGVSPEKLPEPSAKEAEEAETSEKDVTPSFLDLIDYIRQYESLETEQLIELCKKSKLNELALSAIAQVLEDRGISHETLNESVFGEEAKETPIPFMKSPPQIKEEDDEEDEFRMKQYKIFENPEGKIEAVKQGWSWPAFFFTCFWALVKRMYPLGIGVFVAFFLVDLAGGLLGGKTEQIIDVLSGIAGFLVIITFGEFGYIWRESNLRARGFDDRGIVKGGNPENAVAVYLEEKPNRLKRKPHPDSMSSLQRMRRFIQRLWRGEVSLVITFWGCLLGSYILMLPAGAVIGVLLASYSQDLSPEVITYISMWFTIPVDIFVVVAVWRSAWKYQGPAVWAVLAIVVIVLAAALDVLAIVRATINLVG
jgi:hypothetical protein